jgi:anti-anti-sigma factor
MDFSSEELGSIIIKKVNLSRATVAEAEVFKNILIDDIKKGWINFIVNLSECEFIDSTFISVLVRVLKMLQEKGGTLKIVTFNREVQSLLELTRTTKIIEVFKSKSEAISSFKFD